MILQDMGRYSERQGTLSALRLFVNHPGFRFMVVYRSCKKYPTIHPLGILARWWHKRLKIKFGIQIPHTTSVKAGLFLGHFGGIVINPQVTIGMNCNVAQGVTIGQVNRGKMKGCPKVGDRVWIGANAVVVGNITIGDDVLIAPLSYVNFDVPAMSVVMGNPGKIVGTNGSEGYINQLVS